MADLHQVPGASADQLTRRAPAPDPSAGPRRGTGRGGMHGVLGHRSPVRPWLLLAPALAVLGVLLLWPLAIGWFAASRERMVSYGG